MKRLPFLALLLSLAAAASAQAPAGSAAQRPAAPSAPTARVAVIEFQAAVAETNEFQRRLADLQKKYEPRKNQIADLSKQIDTLTQQLQTAAPQLNDEERANRARAIDEKKKQLDRDTQDAQSDFQNDMQQIINDVAGKVGSLMTDYAKKHGFTLVLDSSNQQNATVLWAVDSTDITKAVIEAYNVKSGIPAPPAQGASGSGPAVDAPQPQPAAH